MQPIFLRKVRRRGRGIVVAISWMAALCAAQTPTGTQPDKRTTELSGDKSPARRDLKVEKDSEATGRDLKLERDRLSPTAPAVPRGYAVVIGVAKYPHLAEQHQLQFAESDAEAIHRALISPEGANIPPENVRRLIGPQATLVNITEALEQWLPSVSKPDDRVIVYFAGHGFVQNGRGFLAPFDLRPDRLDETAYPMSVLGAVLSTKVQAKAKVLFTDACHSGKITPATTPDQLTQSLTGAENFLTLTASRGAEQSFEDPNLGGGYGVFTYYLERGWLGAANRNADPIITADELIDYVRVQVKEYARTRGVSQTPQESSDFDPGMILGFNAKLAADLPAQLPFGELVVEATMDNVEVRLDEKPMGSAHPGKPLVLSGVPAGLHTVEGTKAGYEPVSVPVQVPPGTRQTVVLRVQFVRKRNKASADLYKEGRKLYDSQKNAQELEKAEKLFAAGLKLDSQDAEMALYLCYTRQLLGEVDDAVAACKQAIEADKADVAARKQYGIALLETGDSNGAVVQFAEARRLAPNDSMVHSHLAQAYRFAGAFDKSIEAATEALRLDPGNAQAFLWRGDSLRILGKFGEAREDYRTYLANNDMNASVGEKLRFYFIGFGATKKKADQRLTYASQQYVAFAGACECEQRLGNLLRAKAYCERARQIDPEDIYTNFFLGKIHALLFNRTIKRDDLLTARSYFSRVVEINPELEEARQARDYVEAIDARLPKIK